MCICCSGYMKAIVKQCASSATCKGAASTASVNADGNGNTVNCCNYDMCNLSAADSVHSHTTLLLFTVVVLLLLSRWGQSKNKTKNHVNTCTSINSTDCVYIYIYIVKFVTNTAVKFGMWNIFHALFMTKILFKTGTWDKNTVSTCKCLNQTRNDKNLIDFNVIIILFFLLFNKMAGSAEKTK